MKRFELVHFRPLPEVVENSFDRIAYGMFRRSNAFVQPQKTTYWPNTHVIIARRTRTHAYQTGFKLFTQCVSIVHLWSDCPKRILIPSVNRALHIISFYVFICLFVYFPAWTCSNYSDFLILFSNTYGEKTDIYYWKQCRPWFQRICWF